MPKAISKIIIGLILTLTTIETTFACSIRGTFIRPSNYEMVRSTPAIVLAEAVKESQQKHYVDFKILSVLKGKLTEKAISIGGHTAYRGKSASGDFSTVRPGAMAGACNARDYKLGANFLLFLDKHDNKWHVSGHAFTRINEEISGHDSPWLKAVKKYIEISTVDNYEQEKELLRKTLNDKSLNILGLKKDLESHFSTPSSFKSFEDLMKAYNNSEDKNTKRKVLYSLNNGHPKKSKVVFEKLLENGNWIDYTESVTKYLRQEKASEYSPLLANALINDLQNPTQEQENKEETMEEYLAKRLKQDRESYLISSLAELAKDEHKDIMDKVLEVSNKGHALYLSGWFAKHPTKKSIGILKNIVQDQYNENFRITINLAAMGDQGTLNWAKNNALSKGDERWLVRYVFAASPYAEADDLAVEVIEKSSLEDITSLAEGYGHSTNPKAVTRLIEILEKHSDNSDIRRSVKNSLTAQKDNGNKQAAEYLKLHPIKY